MSKLSKSQWKVCQGLWFYLSKNVPGFKGYVKENGRYVITAISGADAYVSNDGEEIPIKDVERVLYLDKPIYRVALSPFIQYDYEMCKDIIDSSIVTSDMRYSISVPNYCTNYPKINRILISSLLKTGDRRVKWCPMINFGEYLHDSNVEHLRFSSERYSYYLKPFIKMMEYNGFNMLRVHESTVNSIDTLVVTGYSSDKRKDLYIDILDKETKVEFKESIKLLLTYLTSIDKEHWVGKNDFRIESILILSTNPKYVSVRSVCRKGCLPERIVLFY